MGPSVPLAGFWKRRGSLKDARALGDEFDDEGVLLLI